MNEILDGGSQTITHQGNEKLPSAGGILAMGIISIVMAGLVGLILGIISTSMAKKSIDLYKKDPNRYDPSSLSQVKSGRTCGIIGLCISSLALLIILLVVIANA